jgi:hypothetical protein
MQRKKQIGVWFPDDGADLAHFNDLKARGYVLDTFADYVRKSLRNQLISDRREFGLIEQANTQQGATTNGNIQPDDRNNDQRTCPNSTI